MIFSSHLRVSGGRVVVPKGQRDRGEREKEKVRRRDVDSSYVPQGFSSYLTARQTRCVCKVSSCQAIHQQLLRRSMDMSSQWDSSDNLS